MSDNMVKLTDKKPQTGVEVILHNPKWINEDYNPKGVRIGFFDDVMGWVSAYWCSYHDCYHTRLSTEDNVHFKDSKGADQIPTHWREI